MTVEERAQPRIWHEPEKPGRLVTLHPCWVADFAGETAVFATRAEAVEFSRKRWRREPVEIRR